MERSTRTSAHFIIRTWKQSDILEVADVVQRSMPFTWSKQVLQDCFKADYHGWVVELCSADMTSSICGFAVVLNQLDECQILNICIDQSMRRQGLASKLLQHIIDFAQQSDLKKCSLEVRASNHAAINLYHQFGFEEVGLRCNYYPTDTGREDACLMARVI